MRFRRRRSFRRRGRAFGRRRGFRRRPRRAGRSGLGRRVRIGLRM